MTQGKIDTKVARFEVEASALMVEGSELQATVDSARSAQPSPARPGRDDKEEDPPNPTQTNPAPSASRAVLAATLKTRHCYWLAGRGEGTRTDDCANS